MSKSITPQQYTFTAVYVFENESGIWPVNLSIDYVEPQIEMRFEVSPTWQMIIPLSRKDAINIKKRLENAIRLQTKPKNEYRI